MNDTKINSELNNLYSKLIADRLDYDCRLVLADFMEESNDHKGAAFQRYLKKHNKNPIFEFEGGYKQNNIWFKRQAPHWEFIVGESPPGLTFCLNHLHFSELASTNLRRSSLFCHWRNANLQLLEKTMANMLLVTKSEN